MANFLLPCSASADHPKKQSSYPTVLSDAIRSILDSIEALALFYQLVIMRKPASRPGFIAFDAHGGDSGCHLRSSMILDAYAGYSEFELHEPERFQAFCASLARTIELLKDLETRARNAHTSLTGRGKQPEDVALRQKKDTPRNILKNLGWTEISGANSSTDTIGANPNSSNSGIYVKGQDSSGFCHAARPLVKKGDGMGGDAAQSNPSWNILDPSVMLRFIVYSYTLSRYKKFKYTGDRLVGLVDPNEAESRLEKLECASTNTPCGRYKRPGVNRLEKEFRDIKSWLSKLSTDWISRTATRLPRLHGMAS